VTDTLLESRGLSKTFRQGRLSRTTGVRAVDGVDLVIHKGRSVGIVGESGSGKSTLARLLLLLDKPTAGTVLFQDEDVWSLGTAAKRQYRRHVQPVFQDPYSSLSPRMRVGSIIAEPLKCLAPELGRQKTAERVEAVLDRVGLGSEATGRYPHEFSGGQRQRIALARALAVEPSLVILDEPVSALDVSIRAQILNLLRDLEETSGQTFLLIAHDLPGVRFITSYVSVMFAGRIVESGRTEDVFSHPSHPYTLQLLRATLLDVKTSVGDAAGAELTGDHAGAVGCPYRTRCQYAVERCSALDPRLAEVGEEHLVACHVAQEHHGRLPEVPT
jgi:oligopeptide transport system ATP-binding protein